MNKWDLLKLAIERVRAAAATGPKHGQKQSIKQLVDETRQRIFFLDYAPVLIASALTGENIDKLFGLIGKVQRDAGVRIGTGVLNRLLRAALDANPPPTIGNKRLKLFYATQAADDPERAINPPKFVLFVNQPKLLADTYARYLEGRIREVEPYPGLPVLLTPRARTETRD